LAFFDLFDTSKVLSEDERVEELVVRILSVFGYGLIARLLAHFRAVAKHHLILEDDTLRRMLP